MADVDYAFWKKQRWIIVVFFFLSGLISASWSSRIPDIQNKLGVNNAVFGFVLFSMYAGLFIGLIIASWLVASYGSGKIMTITCISSAVLLVLTSVFSSFLLLMPILFIMGFSRTIFNLSANTGAIEVQAQYKRPIIAGFHGVWSMACLVAGGIGQFMISYEISPLSHFLVIALLVVVSIFLLERKRVIQSVKKERRPFFVKPDKYLFLLGLMTLCIMLCEGAMFDWSVNYFEKVVKAERSMVTTGYLSFIIAMAGGRLIGDRLIGEFGIFSMLMINGLLVAAGFVITASFPAVFPAALGFLCIGLGDSVLVPILYMLATKSKKMTAEYSLSIVTFIGYLGFLVGPLFIGNVSQHFGLPVTFYCLSGISIVFISLGLQVKKLAIKEAILL
jgi:MFS family permease